METQEGGHLGAFPVPEDPVTVSPLGPARPSLPSPAQHRWPVAWAMPSPRRQGQRAASGSFTSLAGLTVASSGGCPPPLRDRPPCPKEGGR